MSDLKHFGNSFGGADKDVCRACGNESSTHDWINGVCKSCQTEALTDRSINITKVYLKWLTVCVFLIAIVELVLNFATLGFYSKMMKANTLVIRLSKFTFKKVDNGFEI
jgi:hypothetical protein